MPYIAVALIASSVCGYLHWRKAALAWLYVVPIAGLLALTALTIVSLSLFPPASLVASPSETGTGDTYFIVVHTHSWISFALAGLVLPLALWLLSIAGAIYNAALMRWLVWPLLLPILWQPALQMLSASRDQPGPWISLSGLARLTAWSGMIGFAALAILVIVAVWWLVRRFVLTHPPAPQA